MGTEWGGPSTSKIEGGNHSVLLVVYFDNIVILSNMEKLNERVARFSKQIEIMESKTIERSLVISMESRGNMTNMHNRPRIERMLKYFNLSEC